MCNSHQQKYYQKTSPLQKIPEISSIPYSQIHRRSGLFGNDCDVIHRWPHTGRRAKVTRGSEKRRRRRIIKIYPRVRWQKQRTLLSGTRVNSRRRPGAAHKWRPLPNTI
jgi:hypothetical protein